MTRNEKELTRLLDKLYDLISEDNFISLSIKDHIMSVEREVEDTNQNQEKNEIEKVETESQLSIFVTQKEAFISTFSGIDNDTFQALNAIGVDLDIKGMLEQIEERAPLYCDELNDKIAENNNAILEAQQKRDILNNQLNELNERLENNHRNSSKLHSLLKQSLSNDVSERENITARYAKEILNSFDVFSSEEVSILAKVILFPEDGLIDFDETYEQRLNEGLVNLDYTSDSYVDEEYETAEEDDKKEEPEVEEPELEEPEVKEVEVVNDYEEVSNVNVDDDLKVDHVEAQELTEEIYQDIETSDNEESSTQLFDLNALNSEESEEVIELEPTEAEIAPEEVEEDTNFKEIKELLGNMGLTVDKFEENNIATPEQIYTVLEEVDSKTLERNYEVLRSLNIDDDTVYKYRQNHIYLADNDLNKKVTLLRAKGISEHKIKELIENSDSGFREDYETIEKRIAAIENTFDKLSDGSVYLLAQDLTKYSDNLNILSENGYELDDKDIRNNQAVLYNSNYVAEDVEVLKNYFISIQRKNGKYALGIFFKDFKGLELDIDDVIEADLEDLLSAHPEILVNKVDALIARVRYCLNNGESIYKNEESGAYSKSIIDGLKFHKTYNHDALEYVPRNREEVNNSLRYLVENSDRLVDTLNKYYEKAEVADVELSGSAKDAYENLVSILEDKLHIENAGSHTYKIANISVSKNKIYRNLSILAKEIEDIKTYEKEAILVSILYNLRQDEDKLRIIVDSCNVDAQASEDGGAL